MIGTLVHRGPRRRETLEEHLAPLISALGITAIAAAAFFGCAKPTTVIMTEVSADSTVPELLKLQYTVTRASNPAHPASGAVVSLGAGDAGDGRAPFVFPLVIAVGPLAGWSGPVEITVNGREWNTDAIVASGRTAAQAIPEQQSQAALTLTAVSTPGDPDAGTAGDAAPDTTSDAGEDTTSGEAATAAATGS